MPSFQHSFVDAEDYAIAKSGLDDTDSGRRFLRRRLAASLWLPGVATAFVVGQTWLGSWPLAIGLAVVATATAVVIAEGLPFRRRS